MAAAVNAGLATGETRTLPIGRDPTNLSSPPT